MFPEPGLTKLDVVDFYRRIEQPLMTAIRGRPVLMQRFPSGVDGSNFFQKRVPKDTARLAGDVGGQHAERHHVAGAGRGRPRPHRLGREPRVPRVPRVAEPRAPTTTTPTSCASISTRNPALGFDEVRDAARELKGLLDELGIRGWPKTTGNRGIHVYTRLEPRWTPIEVRRAAVAVARELARRRPDAITDAWWKEERGERVFVDFNQNAPHKTVFGAWSVRARPARRGVDAVRLGRARRHRSRGVHLRSPCPTASSRAGDPWADIADDPQVLTPLLEMYDRDIESGLEDAPWPPVYPKMPGEPPRVAPSRAAQGRRRQPDHAAAAEEARSPAARPKRGV